MHRATHHGLRPTHARQVARRIAAVLAASIAFAWSPVALADAGSDEPRFEMTRTADFLFRIDTASGQVWAVPVSGDGGWQSMGPPPGSDSDTSVPGVFKITTMKGVRGRSPKPLLLRTDVATGRAWTATALPDGEWVLIPEPTAPPR